MTLTPTRTSTPLPDPYPWTYAHPSALTTARVQAEEEHQAAQQQGDMADRLTAALTAFVTGEIHTLRRRIEEQSHQLEEHRADMSNLRRPSGTFLL